MTDSLLDAIVAEPSSQGDVQAEAIPFTLKTLRKEERAYTRDLARRQKGMDIHCGLPNLTHPEWNFEPTWQRGHTSATIRSLLISRQTRDEKTYDAIMGGKIEEAFHGPQISIRNELHIRRKINGRVREQLLVIFDALPGGHSAPGQRVRHLVKEVGAVDDLKLGFYSTTADRSIEALTLIAEEKAYEKLAEILEPVDYKQYFLTGTVHIPGRSGVIYVIRRGRPTIAYRKDEKEQRRFIATLCLHPLGYFHDSWAGGMCPTDEVIAHILMIRSDEHHFWKRATHHSVDDPRGDF